MSIELEEIAPLIKGMLKRGDRQSDIAACFLVNAGRIAEINTGQKYSKVNPASPEDLPPSGPYPSPFDLWKAKHALWAARVALDAAIDTIEKAANAVRNAEGRI